VTAASADLYLGLLKRLLTRTLYGEEVVPARTGSWLKKAVLSILRFGARRSRVEFVERLQVDLSVREEGRDWPFDAETMVGLRRLENIQDAVRTVIEEGVPGDWLETGVWRGGASIFAKGCFKAYGDDTRTVWLADSFQGLPKPSLPQDEGSMLWSTDYMAVSVDTVRQNFARYELLDDRVRFLVGWFADTLPAAPIEQLAILRLDGDLYQSTMDALTMYSKVSPGGYVIVDDYDLPPCKEAITDFRRNHRIEAPLIPVDHAAVYWRKL
jgi:O-methyltransferase